MTGIRKVFLDGDQPHLAEFRTPLELAQGESDRGSVLIHASMMDEILKRCIDAFLIQHKDVEKLTNGFNAPMGTFSSRILAAFALGIITSREYEELTLIKKIRNDFAHVMTMSFDDEAILTRCNRLSFAIQEPDFDARSKFVTSAASLILSLVNRPHHVSLKRLQTGDWEY